MNSKLTAKNLLNYLRTTKDKYQFRANKSDSCPIASYLCSLGNKKVQVYPGCISYINSKNQFVSYYDSSSHVPGWIERFIDVYDTSKPKHRLAAATKVLEEVVAKQVDRKMTTRQKRAR